jgi:nicotinamidase-related amidase
MCSSLKIKELLVPPHFNPAKVSEIWKVPYQERAEEASRWAHRWQIQPASKDEYKIALIAIDVQNTFCIPGFELFVAGRSGTGAVDDNRRLCDFVYRNLDLITHITVTLDTHYAIQIFHPIFLVNDRGEHPSPLTQITHEDLLQERWKFNPEIAGSLHIDSDNGQQHLLHYTQVLKQRHKYDLTVWPYHVMLGSIGHALVSAIEEAIFFHTITRFSQVDFEIKGDNPLTEHYSAIDPEVMEDHHGNLLATENDRFIQILKDYDAVFIAGQAKSHCVAWTIDDLLSDIFTHDEKLVKKVYLLEDCTSAVVVPGIVDYTEQADEAFRKFANAGMHVVRSTEPVLSILESQGSTIDRLRTSRH